jgi:hypothetical protein
MTVSFTLGKRFFKVAHYLLRFWIIILMLRLVPFVLEMLQNLWASGVMQVFKRTFESVQIQRGLFYLILIAVGIWYLKWSPKNTYSENSLSPKEEISFWQALPMNLLFVYLWSPFVLLCFTFWISCDTGFQEWENLFLLYNAPAMHLTLSVIALYLARKDYNLDFDKIWPKDSEEVKLIIKYKPLLNGSTPDGLTHLKVEDRVKLIPSDIPGDEDVINVVHETPNGPIMMDKVFSKYLVQRLKYTYIGFMYGTISAFKSLDHIELTISKDGIPLSDRSDWLDLDELFREAALLVVQTQQCSTSMIQRKFELGYNRAGRIVDQLEEKGIVGPFAESKAREVFIASEEELKKRLDEIMEDISGRS